MRVPDLTSASARSRFFTQSSLWFPHTIKTGGGSTVNNYNYCSHALLSRLGHRTQCNIYAAEIKVESRARETLAVTGRRVLVGFGFELKRRELDTALLSMDTGCCSLFANCHGSTFYLFVRRNDDMDHERVLLLLLLFIFSDYENTSNRFLVVHHVRIVADSQTTCNGTE